MFRITPDQSCAARSLHVVIGSGVRPARDRVDPSPFPPSREQTSIFSVSITAFNFMPGVYSAASLPLHFQHCLSTVASTASSTPQVLQSSVINSGIDDSNDGSITDITTTASSSSEENDCDGRDQNPPARQSKDHDDDGLRLPVCRARMSRWHRYPSCWRLCGHGRVRLRHNATGYRGGNAPPLQGVRDKQADVSQLSQKSNSQHIQRREIGPRFLIVHMIVSPRLPVHRYLQHGILDTKECSCLCATHRYGLLHKPLRSPNRIAAQGKTWMARV